MIMEALRTNRERKRVDKTKMILPPTKGWYSQDNIAAGQPGTAQILKNFFPKSDKVELRKGWAQHSDTTETVAVNTLMAYHGTSANKLFAACNDTIYDVTSSSASASSITTLTSSKLQFVNFTTSGGHFLFVVNGSDTAKHYNGSAWATPSITGTTSDNFSYVAVFKGRLYFAVKNSLDFAYLPVNSIAGAASTFSLGDVFNRGGTLVAIGTWTHDGGAGPDDHIAFLTSQGQVAVYQGSDPSDINAWSLVGVYNTARPVGTRCMVNVGGDLYILTEMGVLPMSQAIGIDSAALQAVAITKNISQDINDAARRYKSNFGWQIIAYPKGPMAIINVPISEGTRQEQFVMNTQTGAWCKFTNQNAACWEVMDGRLFFGGNDGKVYEADSAASDGGSDISYDMQTYFDHFGNPSQLKYWKLIRPVIYSDGQTVPRVGMNVDYEDRNPTGAIVSTISNNALWGTMVWGSFTWSGGRTLNAKWRDLTDKPGYVAAVRLQGLASGSGSPILLQVNGFHIVYETGGIM